MNQGQLSSVAPEDGASTSSRNPTAQDDPVTQLWEMIETQQDLLSSYDDTIRSLRDTVQQHQDTIDSLTAVVSRQREHIDEQEATSDREKEQSERQMSALKEMAAIRDIQEDKLDANSEEIKALKATIKTLRTCFERVVSIEAEAQALVQHRGQQAEATTLKEVQERIANITDEELYRRLRELGEMDVAAKLLASARRLDRLMARGRAWIYQNHDAENQSPSVDDTLVKRFVERAATAGIRVGRSA
ncbi:hypothetical protein F4818DRAFT_440609 [Hypoxylon cercidicola]|nr:hypothetical protein F4818DRAFT_440609 [Hypoxylon cercidicola]